MTIPRPTLALAAALAACGPDPTETGTTDAATSSDPDTGVTTTDGEPAVSCALTDEPACADCFLLLASFDYPYASFDQWFASDGASPIEFTPPDGNAAGVAVTADGVGVVVRRPLQGSEMRFLRHKDGLWSKAQPIGFAGAGNTLAGDGRCVHLIYVGEDEQRHHAIFDGESWHPSAAALPGDAASEGSLAARDGELVHVFRDETNGGALTMMTRTDTWHAPVVLAAGDVDAVPRIAALFSGPEFMVVDGARYTTRVAGEWAPLADIPGTGLMHDASVAALRDGRAVVAWTRDESHGGMQQALFSVHDPVAGTWTEPRGFHNYYINQSPIVATGAGPDEFYMAYTFDGTGDLTFFYRVDGEGGEVLAEFLFRMDLSLASTPVHTAG